MKQQYVLKLNNVPVTTCMFDTVEEAIRNGFGAIAPATRCKIFKAVVDAEGTGKMDFMVARFFNEALFQPQLSLWGLLSSIYPEYQNPDPVILDGHYSKNAMPGLIFCHLFEFVMATLFKERVTGEDYEGVLFQGKDDTVSVHVMNVPTCIKDLSQSPEKRKEFEEGVKSLLTKLMPGVYPEVYINALTGGFYITDTDLSKDKSERENQ